MTTQDELSLELRDHPLGLSDLDFLSFGDNDIATDDNNFIGYIGGEF